MMLVGTAPRGGDDIMHIEKPSLARHLGDPTLKGYAVLQKIFFAPTPSSQAAGGAFIERLARRTEDRDPASGPDVMAAQMAAFATLDANGDDLVSVNEILNVEKNIGSEVGRTPFSDFLEFVQEELGLGEGGENILDIPGISILEIQGPADEPPAVD